MSGFQTVLLIASGYLSSRLLLRAGLHMDLLEALLRRARGRISGVILGFMLASFGLSLLVPNALTVLALLPLAARLRTWAEAHLPSRRVGTLLGLGLVFGANLGGVGSLLGSPANLYLLATLEVYQVPGRQGLHFASWLLFGLPAGLSLLLLGWGVLRITERALMQRTLPPPSREELSAGALRQPAGLRRRAARWLILWGGGWVLIIAIGVALGWGRPPESPPPAELLRLGLGGHTLRIGLVDALALALSLVTGAGPMLSRIHTPQGRERLLGPRDLTREVPWRGVLLGLGVLVLLVVVARSGVVSWLRDGIPGLFAPVHQPTLFVLAVITVTIFATEVLNNTTVATVMFPVSLAAAPGFGVDPLLAMLGVSLASTCAFMTPVATPVNALAMAGIGRLSWRRFMLNGLALNLIAALWLTLWVAWLIPLFL